MTTPSVSVAVRPILADDVGNVAQFLCDTMGSRLSAAQWAAAMVPPWSMDAPNHGFMLIRGDEIAGANLAFYSVRTINGEQERFCNLGALGVKESARPHTVRLVRAVLAQRGYHFTDFSPSGNVVELDRRLGFHMLDTATAVTLNLPSWPDRDIRLIWDLEMIGRLVTDENRQIFLDHREALAARHLLVTIGAEQCYIVFRKDRRKRLRIFTSILYVSNRELYGRAARHIAGHMLLRHGAVASFAELRIIGDETAGAHLLREPRPKMFKSRRLSDADVDYLYSELTCVPW